MLITVALLLVGCLLELEELKLDFEVDFEDVTVVVVVPEVVVDVIVVVEVDVELHAGSTTVVSTPPALTTTEVDCAPALGTTAAKRRASALSLYIFPFLLEIF